MSATTATPAQFALSTAETAASIGVAAKTLRNWRAEGLGPRPTRLGGNQVVYRPADIERWLDVVQSKGSVKAAGQPR